MLKRDVRRWEGEMKHVDRGYVGGAWGILRGRTIEPAEREPGRAHRPPPVAVAPRTDTRLSRLFSLARSTRTQPKVLLTTSAHPLASVRPLRLFQAASSLSAPPATATSNFATAGSCCARRSTGSSMGSLSRTCARHGKKWRRQARGRRTSDSKLLSCRVGGWPTAAEQAETDSAKA